MKINMSTKSDLAESRGALSELYTLAASNNNATFNDLKRLIALGRAVEAMPIDTQLRHDSGWDDNDEPIHFWTFTRNDEEFCDNCPTPLEVLTIAKGEM